MTAPRWAGEGTALFLQAVDRLTDVDLDRPSRLPGWSRRHVLAHVASNATALGRLVSWARTGVQTPMYASAGERAEEIERGATQSPALLRANVRTTADELAAAFSSLPKAAWLHQVATAQGRTVPATELSWLRAREVNVHAVDLDAGVGFDDLPDGFCAALVEEIARLRSTRGDGPALRLTVPENSALWTVEGSGKPLPVERPLNRLAGWLAGRETEPNLPTLPAWL